MVERDGSDFWDPLDVAVFTTWVVGLQSSRFGDSSIGDTWVPSRHLFFFGSVQASRLRMLVWTSNLETPNPRSWGNTSPNFFEGLFLSRRPKGRKLGVILLRSIPLLGPFGTPQRLGGGPRVASLLTLAPKPPRGLVLLSVIPSAFDLVHTARVVEGDDSRDR